MFLRFSLPFRRWFRVSLNSQKCLLTLQPYPYICSWDVAAYPRENEWESQFRFRKMPLNTFDHEWHFQSFRYRSSVSAVKTNCFFVKMPLSPTYEEFDKKPIFRFCRLGFIYVLCEFFFFSRKKKIMPNKHVLHFYHVLIYRSGSKKNLMWSVREKTQCENSMWSVREKT